MAHQLDKYLQKGGINIKPENKGKFTKAAKSRGLGVQEFARKVLANKDEYSPLLVKRANFARNSASWKKQNGGAVLEDKEYVKDLNGNIQKLEGFPTHDDYMLVDEEGQYLESTPYNKGGVYMDGIQSVVSATHENRDSSDKSYTEEDEKIKIKKAEGKALGKQLGFNIKFKAGSPSKLLDSIYKAKEKELKKFDIDYNDNLYADTTRKANQSVLESIPSDEDIYDTVFSYQESLKDFDEDTYQIGGAMPITILPMKTKKAQRGVLLNYPTMKGNRPNAQVKLNNGKVVNVDLVDNRSVSMDDIYNKDSVIVNKNKAIRKKK